MIKKSIIVHRVRPPAAVINHAALSEQLARDIADSRNNASNSQVYDQEKMTEAAFNAWIKNHRFNTVGILLTLTPKDNKITALHQVSMVTAIETDYKRLIWDSFSTLPKAFRFASLKDDSWVRWDTPAGYRFLTEEEIELHIKPNHDKVQDYRTKFTGSKAPDPV